jgi:hydrogenase nickel incorporation protein HypA/HybF
MHELSVSENILSIAIDYGKRAEAKKITDLHIVIGQLSSIFDDSIQFYWDIISKDTLCESSRLHFQRKPAVFLCNDCNSEFTLKDEISPCPTCGSIQLQIVSGEEFFLESIEIVK